MTKPLPVAAPAAHRHLAGYLAFFVLLLAGPAARAQRYVPPGCQDPSGCNMLRNPSFEQLINGLPGLTGGFGNRGTGSQPDQPSPPDQLSQPDSTLQAPIRQESRVCGWHAGNRSRANLFHRYDSLSYFFVAMPHLTVPNNFATTAADPQDTHSGHAYAGIVAAEDTVHPGFPTVRNTILNVRQYIAQDVALQAGKAYYAEFYARLSSGSKYAVPDLGIGFNPNLLNYAGNGPMPFPATITGALANDKNWQRVGGAFTATGLEKQLVIGYFGPPIQLSPYASPLLPDTTYPGVTTEISTRAHYFLDDAWLQPVPTASATPTVVVCGPTQLGGCPLPASSGAVYTWSPATGLSNAGSANPTVQPGAPGSTVTYTLTVAIPRGEQVAQRFVSSVQVLTPGPVSVLAAGDDDACAGRGTPLTASGGDGSTYTWSPALGLSATTGGSVMATPASTTTYTVTSACGRSASVTVTVGTACCLLEQAGVQQAGVVDVAGSYTRFAGSPFDAPPGTYFHATADVYLTDDLFVLGKGSVLLFDAGVSLHLDSGGQLQVESATLTAACHDMWGGVYVHPDAGGIRFTGPGGLRSQLRHSYEGVVVEEKSQRTAYFGFTHTDFAHNRRSLTLLRHDSQTLPTDALGSCTFTSDPQYFKAPWDPQSGAKHYSELHVLLHGDFRDVPITACTFANCLVGIHTGLPNGGSSWTTGSAGRLSNCTFDNFQAAGLVAYGDAGTSLLTPAGEPAAWNWQLRGNTFRFPAEGLVNEQYYDPAEDALYHSLLPHSLYPYTFGVVSQNNGLEMELTSNGFWQQQPDTAQWGTYGSVQHVGVYGGSYSAERLERNTFYQLGLGVWQRGQQPTGPVGLLRNVFRNCGSGVRFGHAQYPGAGPAGAAELSCNSYVRADGGWRGGQPVGLEVYLAGLGLRNGRDTTTTEGLLKEQFVEKPGSAPMITISHHGSQQLEYKTFDNYQISIANRTQGANVQISSPGTIPPYQPVYSQVGPAGNVCANDGFEDTGIQLRPSPSVTPSPNGPVPGALVRNWPNPADVSTTIAYRLPPGCRKAELLVRTGVSGRVVQQVTLNPAATDLMLDVRALPAGLYFYSLLADGVPMLTRRLLIDHL